MEITAKNVTNLGINSNQSADLLIETEDNQFLLVTGAVPVQMSCPGIEYKD